VDEHYEMELAQSTRVLDAVDRALERLSEGTYGACEQCGAAIAAADLVADPTRTMCEQHLSLGFAGAPEAATGSNPWLP
jgi:DnaK suppressor protein